MHLTKDSKGLNPGTLAGLSVECIQSNLTKIFLSENVSKEKEWNWKGKNVKIRDGICLPVSVWDQVLNGFRKTRDEQIWLRLALAKSERFRRIQKLTLRNSSEVSDTLLEVLMQSYPKELDIHNCPCLTKIAFEVINKFGTNLEALIIGNSAQILPAEVIWKDERSRGSNDESGWNAIWNQISGKLQFLKMSDESKAMEKSFLVEDIGGLVSDKACNDKGDHLSIKFTTLITPKLTKLVIWEHSVQQKQSIKTSDGTNEKEMNYWKTLTYPFIHNLIFLDLSNCQEIADIRFLLKAKSTLQHLTLHDVYLPQTEEGWGVLKQLNKLRYLDVSQTVELASVYEFPDTLLGETVEALSYLEGLDISGTNLAGVSLTNIVGLDSRENNPLEFLGLLCAHYLPDQRNNLYAKFITGKSNHEQIVRSLHYYFFRPEMFKKALSIFSFVFAEGQEIEYAFLCLELIVNALELYIEDKQIVLGTLCVLYHLVRQSVNSNDSDSFIYQFQMKTSTRIKLLKTIIEAMEMHSEDIMIFRNGVFVLASCFGLNGLSSEIDDSTHIKFLTVILNGIQSGISNKNIDESIIKFCFFLLESYDCSNTKKLYLENPSIIKSLCNTIEALQPKEDEDNSNYIRIIGKFVQSLTNKSPEYSIEFVNCKGLELITKFRSYPPCFLLILMNVSEVESLRKEFFTPNGLHQLLNIHKSLLNFKANDLSQTQEEDLIKTNGWYIFVSVSILVNLLEEPLWHKFHKSMRKEDVLQSLCSTMMDQTITPQIYITISSLGFPSLTHILNLLSSNLEEVKLYAAWTLKCLIYLDSEAEVYIKMMIPSINLLQSASCSFGIEKRSEVCQAIKLYLSEVLIKIETFQNSKDLK